MTKIAVIGSGVVGETLANGFLKYGHAVMRGTRECWTNPIDAAPPTHGVLAYFTPRGVSALAYTPHDQLGR